MIKKFFSRGYIFLVLAFIYIPILILILFSFHENGTVNMENLKNFQFSLTWYGKIGEIKDVIFNTVLLAVISSIIATVLGTIGAIGIFYHKGKLGKVVKGMSQIPVVNSEVVTACALVMTFMLIGMAHRTLFGLYVGHVIITTPFVVLSVMPKLKQMDSSLYEAALDLGATPVQALFKVVLPEILPGIFSGFMLAITLSLDDYIVTATLSPLGYDTISTAVYKAIALSTEQGSQQVHYYKALTAIIFVLTLLVVVFINIRSSKKVKERRV